VFAKGCAKSNFPVKNVTISSGKAGGERASVTTVGVLLGFMKTVLAV
jgi:hypothetical protein